MPLVRNAARERAIGARIRLARLRKTVSQEALGAWLGITFQQVQKYERGRSRVPASALIDIAAFLDEPAAWFLEPVDASTLCDLPDGRLHRQMMRMRAALPFDGASPAA